MGITPMNPMMSIPQKNPGLFKVGDKVRAKGRRIYTVRWKTDDEPEIPTAEEDLEPASDPS